MGEEALKDNVEIVLPAFRAAEQRDGQGLLDLYHRVPRCAVVPHGVVTGKPAVEAHACGAGAWIETWAPVQSTEAERRMDPRVVAASGDEVVVVLDRQRAVGAACSISTDDPAMFDTDLSTEYALAAKLGVSAQAAYEAGIAGALCDEATKTRIAAGGS